MSQSEPQSLYRAPVYRAGMICNLIKGMTADKAKTIRQKLLARWNSIAREIETDPQSSGWKKVTIERGSPEAESHEGPAVIYPPMRVEFKIFDGEARASITVCRPPRHAKLWVRVSYLTAGMGAQHSGALNQYDLSLFFKTADQIVHGQAMSVFLRNYKEILRSELGSDEKLEEAHFIRILTATANLGSVADKLEARAFRLKQSIADPVEYERIRGLLYLTYDRDVATIYDYEHLPAGYEWMSVRTRGDGRDAIGLYSTFYGSRESSYVGLVHSVEDDPKKAAETTRHFSEKLLNDIAPQI